MLFIPILNPEWNWACKSYCKKDSGTLPVVVDVVEESVVEEPALAGNKQKVGESWDCLAGELPCLDLVSRGWKELWRPIEQSQLMLEDGNMCTCGCGGLSGRWRSYIGRNKHNDTDYLQQAFHGNNEMGLQRVNAEEPELAGKKHKVGESCMRLFR